MGLGMILYILNNVQIISLAEIMSAATDVMRAAGAEIVGGHTSVGDELTIGRNTKAGLPMMRSWVSRDHCRIIKVEADWQVEDAESQNGIRVNGEKTDKRLLRNGDIIQVGKVSLVFILVD